MKNRKPFAEPSFEAWGSVTDLTRLGQTDGTGDQCFDTGSRDVPPAGCDAVD